MDTHAQKQHPRRQSALLALSACLFALPFLTLAQPASADLSFCPPGSGAGQCSEPRGLATDFQTARLYVADKGNSRVDVFKVKAGGEPEFEFAFGWGVDTGAPKAETCTTESTCQAGIEGSGAGQMVRPTNIAVDNTEGSPTRHDVYLSTGDFRWQAFQPDGSFISATGWGVDTGAAKAETCTTASTCQTGIRGGGECQMDNAELGSKVDPIAIGPAGNVFVADTAVEGSNRIDRVEKFNPAGVCLGETKLLAGNFTLSTLAVDASEDAYLSIDGAGQELRKYDLASPETKLCDLDPGIETKSLSLDEAGNLFAAQREPPANSDTGDYQVITEYDSACKLQRRFGYGKIAGNLLGLATFPSPQGDVFGSEGNEGAKGITYLKIPPPGPIVAGLEASPLRSVSATIKAKLNPEGKETKYKVEYVDQHSYETEGGFAGPSTRSSGEASLGASDFRVHFAELDAGCRPFSQLAFEEGKCLKPETAYRYRVVASNPDGKGEAEGQFSTGAPLGIESTFVSEAGTDGATLNAWVNPNGSPAHAYFEYVDEATFLGSGFTEAVHIPATGSEPLSFGAGEEALRRSAVLYPLPPATTYRYRLIAEDPFGTLISPEHAFTTFTPLPSEGESCPANEAFRTAASALLPDCRAYEMVSPPDKSGGDIVSLFQIFTNLPAVLSQSATSGEKLAYGSYRAFGDAPSAPWTSQYIASRGSDGWQSHGITPPGEGLISKIVEFDFEFRAFSNDLCEAWIIPGAEPPLAEGAIPGYLNLYRRSDRLCGAEGYEALTTSKPENLPGIGSHGYSPELQGRSADGSVVAFAAYDSLEGSGASSQGPTCAAPSFLGCQLRTYLQTPGQSPRFACVLPNGQALKESCSAGSGGPNGNGFAKMRSATLTNALSADGSKLYWTASAGDGPIYLRENPLAEGSECAEEGAPCTLAVSKAAEEEAGTSSSRFWSAAKDGSVAIFTSGDFGKGKAGLYEYEVSTKATHKIAGGVLGFLGASQDASHVYFASNEVLTAEEENSYGDKAQPGEPNLYLHVVGPGGGTYRFIATLAGDDVNPAPPQQTSSATAIEPSLHNGRVSTDGSHAAFMSAASLTGYDNTDVASPEACGKPKGICDTEAYVYDAGANGGEGELHCVSCNPSGARPTGANPKGVWVAGRIPPYETTLYAPRVMSEDGSRLFFESADALVPHDTNGRIDVYEWELAGTGGCGERDATFSDAAEGCIDLVSSGQSKRDSELVDASPSGHDVFFTTLSGLLPQDFGLLDIYDAREGGGFPAQPQAAASCEGEACQSPPEAPNDPTPASSSFEGAGNVVEAKAKKKKAHGKKHKHAKKKNHPNRRNSR